MFRALVLLLLFFYSAASAAALSSEAAYQKVTNDDEMRSLRINKRIEETDFLYDKALLYQNAKFGSGSLATGIQLSNWGSDCISRGANASALLLFRKAAAILERYPRRATAALADCYRGFAYADQDAERWLGAETNLKRSLSLEKIDPLLVNSERHAMTLEMVGRVLMKQRKWKDADAYFSESLKMREKTYGLLDSTSLSVMRDLATAQKHLGSTELQNKWRRLTVEYKKKRLGPKLGPLYERLHREVQSLPDCLVFRQRPSHGINSVFSKAAVEKDLVFKFGEGIGLPYRIPLWMAGLWGTVPENTETVEVGGFLVNANCFNPFMGSGPYATRYGKMLIGGSWFDLDKLDSTNNEWWLAEPSDKVANYTFCRKRNSIITQRDDLILRTSLVHILVDNGRIKNIWQEDQIEAWSRLEEGTAAVYKAIRYFDSEGNEVDESPDGSGAETFSDLSTIKKVGGPHPY